MSKLRIIIQTLVRNSICAIGTIQTMCEPYIKIKVYIQNNFETNHNRNMSKFEEELSENDIKFMEEIMGLPIAHRIPIHFK